VIERRTRGGKIKYRARHGRGPSKSFDRWQDAKDYEEAQRRNTKRARAGMEVEKGGITYDDLCELFLSGYRRRSKDWTIGMLAYSRAKWGKVYVRQLEPELIQPWLQSLTARTGKPLAEKTRHHILERMRAVCEMGVEWGYLSRSPVRPRAVQSPGTERVTAITPFESWAGVEVIADELAKEYAPWGCLVRFVCATGLRPGEWRRLTWGDVIDQTELRVPGTKTEAAVRTIPLSDLAYQAVTDMPTPIRDALPLFTTKTGKPLNDNNYDHWRKTYWKLAFVNAGVPYREPYEMRHTFATLALTAGVPLEIISTLMGHKSIEITRRYYAKFTRTTLGLYVPLLNKMGDTHEPDSNQVHAAP
jgi:integrase